MSDFSDPPARLLPLSHDSNNATPSSRTSSVSPPHVSSPKNTVRWNPYSNRDPNRELNISERRPTYFGYIKTPADAILLLAACDLPEVPNDPSMDPPPRRISRRLLDDERASLIRSGSIFVWDEREAGMRRWTDGHCWSASRVSGCFLTYRELEMRKKNADNSKEAPRGNLYKQDGLIKQSFSITTASNRKLHVISYFLKNDVRMGRLQRVSKDPRISGRGPGSWNVQVDEEEFGELLSRENERLPNHIVMDIRQPPYVTDEKRAMKRTLSDESSTMSSPASDEHEQVSHPRIAPRLASVAYPSYDRGYTRYPAMNSNYAIRDDNVTMKRYRYDRSRSPSYSYYPEQRGWTSRYDTASHMLPLTPPLSTSSVPVGYTPRSKSGPYTYTAPRPQLPPLQYPRSSEAEKGTLEALANLCADGPRCPPYPAALPYKTSGYGPIRPRFAPVSATDRHTLQKLSVPM
ncbi:Similar to S.cerevisiae protein YHR177W (Putative transcription factor containing a WOPR domain) [Malassezia sympodialis ATCC 42132]|uniref:Similar to S.cerevisiae protein YHR177W (Putative transcription factor containing a WOPR domain) n=1 Tax=Malassezia sympodialis (strain ATCC 42132) TaxID=1230383 RepID=A0A1M8A235_MALS4|nr:Similar to S.cerevisiae protein YHR177W (Putative transcription factor containing a WOPR domain) [Malassezia sympodialis ATCC 42132]